MGRSGYSDDFDDDRFLHLYRGTVASAIRGKRGQKLLRDALAALDEMPAKRLIPEQLVNGQDVCLLGAVGRKRAVSDLEKIDPEDHGTLSKRFDVAECLVREVEYVNDDDYRYREETPEQRYERVRKWIVKNLKEDAAQQPA